MKPTAIVMFGWMAIILGGLFPYPYCYASPGLFQESSEKAAEVMLEADQLDAKKEYLHALARAYNLTDESDFEDAKAAAYNTYSGVLKTAGEVYLARLDLVQDLNETSYNPIITPSDFVDTIDNPYLPFKPGTVFTYKGDTPEGEETIVVEVTHETKEVLGVQCIVVRDTVTLEGELIEDTYDWFAQDKDGNVWYFGELVRNYEDGELADLDGSWKAGVDGALPGIVMQAAPAVGDVYRMEYVIGEAEDAARVLSTDEAGTIGFGSFTQVLMTEDFTPLDPGAVEHKYYAPGIGFLLEYKPDSGELLQLVDIQYK